MKKPFFSLVPFELSSIILHYLYQLLHFERFWDTLLEIKSIFPQSYWIYYPFPGGLASPYRHIPQVQTEWLIRSEALFSPITWYNLCGNICGNFYERGLYIYPRMLPSLPQEPEPSRSESADSASA